MPKLTKLLADALRASDHPENAVKVARIVIDAIHSNPDLAIKWMIREGLLDLVGYANAAKPTRIKAVPITLTDDPVYMRGLEE